MSTADRVSIRANAPSYSAILSMLNTGIQYQSRNQWSCKYKFFSLLVGS